MNRFFLRIALVGLMGMGAALIAGTAQAQSSNGSIVEPNQNNAIAEGELHHAELCCEPFDTKPNFSNLILDDVLVSDLPSPTANQIASFNDAINTVKNHIDRAALLNASQLVAVNDKLNENISALKSDRESMVKALELVAVYENQHGGLFTRGSSTEGGFSKTAEGFELENIIIDVMQGLVDHSYTRPNIRFYPNVFRDKAFQTSEFFPGAVDTSFNEFHSVRINGTHMPTSGTRNLYASQDVRRPTGTYLAPGSVATVKVPSSMVNRGVSILVGGHTYDFSSGAGRKSDYKRMDRISTSFEIDNPIMTVANPLGGAIFLNIPIEQDHGIVDLDINNAVSMPYFARTVANHTSLADWVNTIRHYPAPWAIIESDKFMYETSSISMGNYDDPESTLRDWDDALDAVSELYARQSPRSKTMLYIQSDRSPRAANFAPGYPQSHSSFDSLKATPSDNPLTNPFLAGPKNATGGTLPIITHELGHSERNHLFRNELEASVMVPWIAIQNRKFGLNLDDAMVWSFHTQNLNIDQSAILWAVTEQFRNNENMPGTSHFYNWGKWPEIARLHGWDAIEGFYQLLSDEKDKGNNYWFQANSREEQDRMILQMAKGSGIDLTPLLHFWGIVPHDLESVKAQVAAESGIEKSRPIYDQLLRYKSMIPVNNAQFREFALNTGRGDGTTAENIVNFSGTRRNWGNGFYQTWWDDYTDREGGAARAQIDFIINTYFPNGRPADAIENVAATVYEHSNSSGYNVRLEVGEYPNLDSTVLNDQISAVRVAEGYLVELFEDENFKGKSVLVTPQSEPSIAATFNDVASSAKVYTTSDKPVKVYTGSNYTGTVWQIGQGTTRLFMLQNSPVGNDSISSIEIPQGYSVKLCTDGGGGGVCKTYTKSVAQLESPMYNSVSHIEIGINIGGNYLRKPVLNNWHIVNIEQDNNTLWWTNKAGIRCPLRWVGNQLMPDASCPYGERAIGVEYGSNGGITGIRINGETYDFQGPSVAGDYQRNPVQNKWHYVTIVEERDKLWWTNQAGIRCPLAWREGRLMADASCPYGVIEFGVTQDQDGGVVALTIRNEVYVVSSSIGQTNTTLILGAALAEAVGPVTDSDQDGVPDLIELSENTDPADGQSFLDSDSDGVSDSIDTDTDGDGVNDLNENGSFPYYDRDRDGVPAYLDDNDYDNTVGDDNKRVETLYDPDLDGIASFKDSTSELLTDSDGDQVPDNVEAINGTDPFDETDFADHDQDRIPDYSDADDDNDGIADVIEGSADTDGDGVENRFDTDSDGDGFSDAEEGMADIDGDALPNFLDSNTQATVPLNDRDGDGIADEVEGTLDSDQDGIANFEDEDSDNDWISDLIETNADLDGDGIPNYLDDDSDGDSISDQSEGALDEDGDSQADFLDHEGESTELIEPNMTGTNAEPSISTGAFDRLMTLLLVSFTILWWRRRARLSSV